MSLLEELKRRKVTRAALLYAAAGWAVVQVSDTLQQVLLLPDFTPRLVFALVVLGAPFTLMMAWMFDVRPDAGALGEVTSGAKTAALTPGTIAGALGFLAVGAAAGFFAAGGAEDEQPATVTQATAPTAPLQSIAVLRFDDLSQEGTQQSFADGLAEELMNTLRRVPGLSVTARTSSFAFSGRALDAATIGDSLGVGSLLEATIRSDGRTIRLSATLVDTDTGVGVWSSDFDGELAGGALFDLQQDIATAVVEQLSIPLGVEVEEGLVAHRTDDFDTYQTFLEARELFRARAGGMIPSIERLEQVVVRDPTFAPAWALLAESYPIRGNILPPDSVRAALAGIRRAQHAAETALALDSTFAAAWAAMGTVSRERLDWEGAELHLRKAVELDPEYGEAHSNLGEILSALDRHDEALPHHLRAIELEPRNMVFRTNMGWLAHVPPLNESTLEHTRAALDVGRAAVEAGLQPNLGANLWTAYALNLTILGRFEEARAVVQDSPLEPARRAAFLTVLSEIAGGTRTEGGRAALVALEGDFLVQPSLWVRYGDLEGAARIALDIVWNYPYMWAGFLNGLPELRGYPDFEEARRRRGLPD